MRTLRAIAVAIVAGATLVQPVDASADGGAYIEMDRTHYVVGSTAEGVAYVSIPEPHQDLLERGPFHVYVEPEGAWIRQGRPIPDGAIRVGTASIVPDGGRTFAIRVSFTVPDVVGAYYNIQICNDPCTVAGFREPLSAYVSIVETEREAELLNELEQAQRGRWSARRDARRAGTANAELEGRLEQSLRDVVALSAEVSRLERELAGIGPQAPITAPPVGGDRPLVEAWALFGIAAAFIAAALAIVLAIVFSRRPARRILVPDTIAELEGQDEPLVVR
ncbi:MAG: hypothetical protein ACXWX9_03290 [Actinomycetota bacterium]